MTIEQAVQEAVEHNLNLLAERYNLSIADARIITAKLRPNPVVSAGVDYIDFQNHFNADNSGGPTEYNFRTDFVLERGGKRERRIEVAQTAREVAQLQLLNTTRTLVLDVQSAFVDVLQAKDNLALARENLQAFQSIVDVNTTRVRAGDLAKVELVRTQVAALQFQSAVRQAESKLKIALNRLQTLMGRTVSSPTFDAVGTLRRDSDPVVLETVTAQALELRPDLLALRKDQARSQAEIRSQLAQGKVDFTVGTEFHRQFYNGNANALGFFFRRPCRSSTGTRARSSARAGSRSRFWRASALPRRTCRTKCATPGCSTRRRANCWRASSTICWTRRAKCAPRWSTPTGAARPRWWSFWMRSAPSTTRGRATTTRARILRAVFTRSIRSPERQCDEKRKLLEIAEAAYGTGETLQRRVAECARGSREKCKRVAGTLLLCIVLLLAGCGRKDEPPVAAAASRRPGEERLADGTVVIPPDSPKLKEIHVAEVKTASVPFDEVTSPGKIETNPNLVSRVALPLAGRVSSVLVKLGDAVKRGDALLTLESPDADAGVAAYLQGQAAITQAKANLNKAQADYDRATDLFEHNAVAKKDVLTAENALAQAKAALEQAQAALEQSDRKLRLLGLKPGDVRPEGDGARADLRQGSGDERGRRRVSQRYERAGDDDRRSEHGLGLLRRPESAIRFIQVGERIDVELTAYPGETFHGRVTRIADTVDPQTRTIKVRAEMDNSKRQIAPGDVRHHPPHRFHEDAAGGARGRGAAGRRQDQRVGGDRARALPAGGSENGRARRRHAAGAERAASAGTRIVVDGAMLLRAQ